MRIFRIHPSPFVTTGFLLAFVLLVGFLYGFPMMVSQADDNGETGSEGERSLECDFNPQSCACNVQYCQPPPSPTCTNPHECTQSTPEPTPIDCNGPFHPSCFTATPIPTPEPTTPPPTTPPPTTPPPTTRPPILNPYIAPTRLTGNSNNCDDATCDITLSWDSNSQVSEWTATRKNGPRPVDWTLVDRVSTNSVTDTDLRCGPTYQFRVTGRRSSASRDSDAPRSYSTESVLAECVDPPTPTPIAIPTATPGVGNAPFPTRVNVSNPTRTSLVISWSEVTDGYRYQVEQKSGPGAWSIIEDEIDGLSFTKTGLICGTGYAFRVSTRGDGSPLSTDYGNPSTERPGATSACSTTPPPNPTPAPTIPTFNASLSWTPPQSVFEGAVVLVTITNSDGTTTDGTYEFRVNTNSSETGLQIDDGDGRCKYTTSPSLVTGWAAWETPLGIAVVRCSLGSSSNRGFAVVARETGTNGDGTQVATTGYIEQAYHLGDTGVTYRVSTSVGTGILQQPIHYRRAADIWQGNTPLTFTRVTSGDADVIMKTYGNTDPIDRCLSITIDACIEGSSYPEFSPGRTIWFKYPPKLPTDGRDIQWTEEIDEFHSNTENFRYLIDVIVHEFGHSLGLQHTPETDSVMHEYKIVRDMPPCSMYPDVIMNYNCGLSGYDIAGANAIY